MEGKDPKTTKQLEAICLTVGELMLSLKDVGKAVPILYGGPQHGLILRYYGFDDPAKDYVSLDSVKIL